jgi:hypothetical protein
MENSLKVLRDPSIIDELKKTVEGKTIVERMLQLEKQLENLGDSEKLKFNEEFGEKFADSLGRLVKNDKRLLSLDIYLAVIASIVLITLLGNAENQKNQSKCEVFLHFYYFCSRCHPEIFEIPDEILETDEQKTKASELKVKEKMNLF